MKTQIIRKLDKSYFLLRTHDKIDHFLQPQVERIFHSSKNSMGRFLPPAKIIQEKGGRSVCYYLTKMQAKTLRPLKEITLPELNALKKAATDFLSPEKVHRDSSYSVPSDFSLRKICFRVLPPDSC